MINEQFVIRSGVNSGATYNGNRRIDDLRYRTSRKTDISLEVMGDWYPFSNRALRLTGGLVRNDTESRLTAKADSSGSYTINRTTSSSAKILRIFRV